jgi:hypothetical protein
MVLADSVHSVPHKFSNTKKPMRFKPLSQNKVILMNIVYSASVGRWSGKRNLHVHLDMCAPITIKSSWFLLLTDFGAILKSQLEWKKHWVQNYSGTRLHRVRTCRRWSATNEWVVKCATKNCKRPSLFVFYIFFILTKYRLNSSICFKNLNKIFRN